MNFFRYINEEYCIRSGKTEVFVNPDSSDLMAIKKTAEEARQKISPISKKVYSIRFTADASTKKLYVWDAGNANHRVVVNLLKKKRKIKSNQTEYEDPNLLNGLGRIEGNKITMDESDDFWLYDRESVDPKLDQDWDWLKPYFVDLKELDKLRKTRGKDK
jgi:hypothetical protein